MITTTEKQNIVNIYKKYGVIHDKLTELSNAAASIEMARTKLSQELEDIRNSERELINKIEKESGIKLGQAELLEIIKYDGNEG